MRIRVLCSLAVAGAVFTACDNERAITSAPVGEKGFGQNLIKQSTNLPRGRVFFPAAAVASATPATDSVVVELAGLDSLSTGQYVVWVANDSATKFARATGNLTIARLDTTLNAQGDPVFTPSTISLPAVSGFSNGRQNYMMRFASTRALITGLAAVDSANVVIVSVETGTPGAAPSDRRFLFARRSQSAAQTIGGVARTVAGFRFGNFAARTTEEFVYATSGSAAVAFPALNFATATTPNIPRGRIEVRGPVFTVNDSNYYRPPIGFFYEAWAIRIDTLGRFIDTVSLGVKASPFPNRISFFEADKSIPDPTAMFGTPTPVIFASQHRVSADTIPDARKATVFGTRAWTGFAFAYVTLQNKAGPRDRMGAAAVMTTGLPVSIVGR